MEQAEPVGRSASVATVAADGEAALIAAVVGGDRTALATLYDAHAGRLVALVTRILGDPSQAEDLVHDVFVEAWHHAHEFDPRRGSVRAWLTMRARSRALDRIGHRERGARIFASPELQPRSEASGSGMFEVHHDAGVLRSSLLDLPEDLAHVIAGAYYDGMSAADLADRFGIPVGTVKSRLARAIAHLRERLVTPAPFGGDA